LLEHVADAAGTHANEHLHEIRTTDAEKGRIGLARDGFRQQGFTRARRTDHEDAFRNTPAQFLKFLRVFQEFDQLLPWKTVRQNIVFALTVSGKLTRQEAEVRAMHFIEKVRLTEFAGNYPHTLSGGMKQRVAIARAMAMEPEILLMDEPFAALDAMTRSKMQEELLQLWDDAKFTLLFVTHSIPEALRVGSRILLLSAHPGQVKAEINSQGTDAARVEQLLFGEVGSAHA